MPEQTQTRVIKLEMALLAPDDEEPRRRTAVPGLPWMDESTFRAFYAQTARPLLAYLVRACGERTRAEDFWQEAYCRLLTSKTPQMDERQARSYLFQIATNLMRDKWRRPKEEPLADGPCETAPSAGQLDLSLGMRQAFHRLKPRERQLLWLAYVEGSSHKEIADCTGLRTASISLLLFRARRKLASLIGETPRRCPPGVAE